MVDVCAYVCTIIALKVDLSEMVWFAWIILSTTLELLFYCSK
jgi:hypothetical protein